MLFNKLFFFQDEISKMQQNSWKRFAMCWTIDLHRKMTACVLRRQWRDEMKPNIISIIRSARMGLETGHACQSTYPKRVRSPASKDCPVWPSAFWNSINSATVCTLTVAAPSLDKGGGQR